MKEMSVNIYTGTLLDLSLAGSNIGPSSLRVVVASMVTPNAKPINDTAGYPDKSNRSFGTDPPHLLYIRQSTDAMQ